MKKVISLILALSILIGMFSILGASAYAENEDDSVIRAGDDILVSIDKDAGIEMRELTFIPQESGMYELRSYSENGDWTDPYVKIYENGSWFGENDDDTGLHFRFSKRFEEGKTYSIKLFLYDSAGNYHVTLKKVKEIKALHYEPVETYSFYEECGGWWNGATYYYELESYNSSRFFTGDKLTVTYDDDAQETYTFSQNEGGWFNASGEEFSRRISFDSEQYEKPWSVNGSNEFWLTCEEVRSNSVHVNIIENPNIITGLEYIPVQTPEVMENTCGEWGYEQYNYNPNVFFHFNEGDVLKVTYKSGTTIAYTYDEQNWQAENGDYFDSSISTYTTQNDWYDSDEEREINAWGVGKNNYMQLCVDRVYSNNISVRITENPKAVVGVQYTPAQEYKFMEQSGGHFDYNGNYVYSLQSYNSSYFCTGDTLRLTRRNGNTDEYTYREMDGWLNEQGESVEINIRLMDNQDESPWSVGGNNAIWVMCEGVNSNTLQATIIENPKAIVDFEYLPAEANQHTYEHTNGKWTTVGGTYYFYDIPSVMDYNNKLLFKFRDGTQDTYYYSGEYWWYNAKEEYLEIPFNGNLIEQNQSADAPWGIGEHTYSIHFLNQTKQLTYRIEESGVKTISVLSEKPIQKIEGFGEKNDNWDESFTTYNIDLKDLIGATIQIEYKDGSVQNYVGKYNARGFATFANAENETIEDELSVSSDQWFKPWRKNAQNFFTLKYRNVETQVPVEIIDNPITSVTLKQKEIPSYYKGYDYNLFDEDNACYLAAFSIGDQLVIDYNDGTQDTYTYQYPQPEESAVPSHAGGRSDPIWQNADGKLLDPQFIKGMGTILESDLELGINELPCSLYDKAFTFKLNLVEIPVASIAFELAKPLRIVEGTSIDYCEYDEESGEVLNTYYYFNIYQPGNKLILTMKDGTKSVYTAVEKDAVDSDDGAAVDFYNENGERLDRYITAHEQTLIPGINQATISYLGIETTIPIELISNPISGISVNAVTAPIENLTGGDYIGTESFGIIYEYTFNQNNLLEGTAITVTYKDGTTQTYTKTAKGFVNAKGEALPHEDTLHVFSKQWEKPWSVGKNNTAILSYLGHDVEIGPIEITAHEHRYENKVTKAPTCTEAGVRTFTCACGDTYTEPVAALGHDFGKWTQTKAPTCTAAGEENRVCSRDASHIETREVAALGHDFGEWTVTKAATCTETGVETRVCANDASHTETREIPATGHNYQAVVTAAKATALGYTRYQCACGAYKKDAKGNVVKDKFTAPTGKQTLKCKARTVAAQTVYWNKVKPATGYQVQISTKDGKKWSTYATLKAGVTNYTFKKLAAGNHYKFRVRFYIAAGGKNYFSPWSKTLSSPTLPAGTVLTKLTPAKRAFVAQWKKQAVNGYQVQYSLKANFAGAKTITVKNPKLLKATAAKLYAGKYYFVRIRTYKTIAKANYFSTWSKTYKVKTKK